MAAMTYHQPIDPSKTGRYPIVVNEELLREDRPRKRQRVGIQYNHRPSSLEEQSATVKPSKNRRENNYDLLTGAADGDGGYIYEGIQEPSTCLAIIYDPEKQAFILDKIDAEFRFNLRSTPTNKNASSLATEYPQLDTGEPNVEADGRIGDDAEGENLDDTPADPSNPYDYRHFLKRGASPSPEPSIQYSPAPNHHCRSSPHPTTTSPIRRPRSRTEPTNPSRHRNERYLSQQPREEADADNEDSDSNELVIDMGDPVPKGKPWRSALGVLNEGARGSGPISLRSAASSMSPSVRGESDDEKEDKSDHDVEEIDLGESQYAATNQGAAIGEGIANGTGWDDDDDGLLEAELEQAMEEQAESEQRDQRNRNQQITAAESSEESEEE